MALTPKYDLEELDYGTTGWNGIQQNNNELIDTAIQTRAIIELGEDVVAYQAVYIKSDAKLWLAQANGVKQPMFGLMVEAGSAGETDKRVYTRGEITNGPWTWTQIGQKIYLDPLTPGELTETPTGSNEQVVGIILSSTKIFLTSLWQSSLVGNQPYIVAGGYTGKPPSSLVIIRHPITNEVPIFPAGLNGSKMVSGTAATASTIFSIEIDAVQFGTATFAGGATTATFIAASETKFGEGQVLTVVAPASQDATLADLGISLRGTRASVTTTTTTSTTSSSSSTTSSTQSSTSTSSSSSTTTSSSTSTTTA